MLSRLFGHQKSIIRSYSSATDKSSNNKEFTDYSSAIKLEESTIRLQNAQRKCFTEFITILSNSSIELEKWKQKWHQFYEKHQYDEEILENLWELFDACILSMDIRVEETNLSMQELIDVRDSIPTSHKNQSLKSKINQAQVDVNELDKELNHLKENELKLRRKIQSSSNITIPKDLDRQRTKLQKQITKKQKLLNEAIVKFDRKQIKLYEQSQKNELTRCALLKEKLEEFVDILHIESDDFNQIFNDFNPEEELEQWRQNTYPQDMEQTSDSQKILKEEETGIPV
ncbi:hypothetical protein I4U23_030960 [Adineta vaga]|nr:hypothetical protein I4U23_030960 [Adineta vaga]